MVSRGRRWILKWNQLSGLESAPLNHWVVIDHLISERDFSFSNSARLSLECKHQTVQSLYMPPSLSFNRSVCQERNDFKKWNTYFCNFSLYSALFIFNLFIYNLFSSQWELFGFSSRPIKPLCRSQTELTSWKVDNEVIFLALFSL